MQIFLDLDDVLADFVGGICRAHGIRVEEMLEFRVNPDGTHSWAVDRAIWMAWGSTHESWGDLTPKERCDFFWGPTRNDPDGFWRGLDPLPWAEQLVDLVSEFDQLFQILTNPMDSIYAYTAKLGWLQRHLRIPADRVWMNPRKCLLAAPNRVLIDDSQSNLREWHDCKGISLGFPATRSHKLVPVVSGHDYTPLLSEIRDNLERICF